MPTDLKIAYILKGFPRLSETFIAHEIHLLENMGLRFRLFSIIREDKHGVHDVVTRIKAPLYDLPQTTSLSSCGLFKWLNDNLGQFRQQHLALLRLRPARYLATLRSAIAMTSRYRDALWAAPRKVFIKEFLQAGIIAERILADGGVGHLHGHFCHGATTVTWFVSQLTGLPFSFTAHAKDIYEKELNPGDLLARKIAAASFVTTCTDANQQHLSARFAHGKLVHTIYHGLDTSYFAPPRDRDALESESEPVLLAVGRLVEKKGFADLVRACAQLKESGHRFRCLIVGERGDQSDAIAELISSLGLSDTVRIMGPRTQAQLRLLYGQATVFVLPCLITDSGDRDGIPNVMAEAMAMGVPVVSTPISGIPELVADGKEGLLVPARDPAALAAAVARLLDDPAQRARISAAARARICACFDSSQTTTRLRDLFLDQLRAREGGHAHA